MPIYSFAGVTPSGKEVPLKDYEGKVTARVEPKESPETMKGLIESLL